MKVRNVMFLAGGLLSVKNKEGVKSGNNAIHLFCSTSLFVLKELVIRHHITDVPQQDISVSLMTSIFSELQIKAEMYFYIPAVNTV